MSNKILHYGALALVTWLLFNLSAAIWVDPAYWPKIVALALFGLTLVRPAWGIGAFLIGMPFLGGSKPGDPHTIRFLELLTILNLALSLRLVGETLRGTQRLDLKLHHPLVFTLGIYWLIALLSLSTVPPEGQLHFFLWPDPLAAYSFLSAHEAQSIYPWLAWSILSQVLFLGFVIHNLSPDNQRLGIGWTFCVLGGLVITLILGPLDFYDIINLSKVRPAFALEAYGDAYRHLRLSSVFGNPGWYAQFVTLATPAVLAILTLPLRTGHKIAALIVVMALTEFTLILAYQRGGWLAYPLTLVAVWFAIYVLEHDNQSSGEVLAQARAAAIKILISVPITIALTLMLIYVSSRVFPNLVPNFDRYVDRASQVTQTRDRLVYWGPTSLIAKEHPFLGPGNESFAIQYERLFLAKDAPYRLTEEQKAADIMQGSAHNMYFQALAGKGIVGLVSLLSVLWVSFSLCWRLAFTATATASGPTLQLRQRLVLMMGLCFTAALALYGNVGEMFYTPINYVLFGFLYALVVREVPTVKPLSASMRLIVLSAVLLAFAGHLVWEYAYPGNTRKTLRSSDPTGCYNIEGEDTRPTEQYRWCSKRFSVTVPPGVMASQSLAALTFVPNTEGDTPFRIRVYHEGSLLTDQAIPRGIPSTVWVRFPDHASPFVERSSGIHTVTLDIVTNHSFIPSLLPAIPRSTDTRNLSVQWLFNREQVQTCYADEGDPAVPASQFRWCPNRFAAKLPVDQADGENMALITFTAPVSEGRTKPFTVRVRSAGRLLMERQIPRGEPQQLRIPLPSDASVEGGVTILDFETDDAFVPSLESKGASTDSRLLSLRWHFNQ